MPPQGHFQRQALTHWITYPEDTKGLHLPSTPWQNQCTRLTLAYSIYPEWGWPVMTWDPYCTPPEVTPIARLGQLRKHQAATHPRTNLATPCLTSVISRELVYPKCYALANIYVCMFLIHVYIVFRCIQ